MATDTHLDENIMRILLKVGNRERIPPEEVLILEANKDKLHEFEHQYTNDVDFYYRLYWLVIDRDPETLELKRDEGNHLYSKAGWMQFLDEQGHIKKGGSKPQKKRTLKRKRKSKKSKNFKKSRKH